MLEPTVAISEYVPDSPVFLSILNPVSLDDESVHVRFTCEVDTGDAVRDAGEVGTVTVGGGVVVVRVVAVTILERPPNTAP